MRHLVPLLLVLVMLSSCKKDSSDSGQSPDPNVSIEELVVDPNFDFRTEEQITLNISDPETYRVKYTV